MKFRILGARLALLLGLAFAVMLPPSYFRYSTIGLDTDRLRGDMILHSYFRLRFPGDGTFRVGGGTTSYTLDEEDLDPVDLAGRLFRESEAAKHRAAWFAGFGVWRGPEQHDIPAGKPVGGFWVSMPAWLPPIALLLIGVLLRHQHLKRSRKEEHGGSSGGITE